MKLVIIEDDPFFAALVARALEGLVQSVVIVSTWEEAAYHFPDRDVAWVDLRISPEVKERESLEFIKKLRVQQPGLVIIVGSGFISPEFQLELEAVGVDACFHKDSKFSVEQVASIVLAAMMRANLRGNAETKTLLTRALEWMHHRHPEAVI